MKEDAAPVFVLGAARSGTTWLAKILDSHPDVLYRHEPDIDRRPPETLPPVVEAGDVPAHLAQAGAYFRSLLEVRTLKSVGSLPVFAKSWDPPLGRLMRAGLVYAMKAASRLPGLARPLRRVSLPAFGIPPRKGLVPVVKTVSQLGRSALLVAALPEARFVLLIRHPCGQVDSQLRGLTAGAFEDHDFDPAPPCGARAQAIWRRS
ncbi:MAG: sulfotransferase [Acetobacteraceae bacterium]|nr:sulfotransferase [Acetobacteraceae bacterium]